MKKNLALLASSTMIALTFAVPPAIYGAEDSKDKDKEIPSGIHHLETEQQDKEAKIPFISQSCSFSCSSNSVSFVVFPPAN